MTDTAERPAVAVIIPWFGSHQDISETIQHVLKMDYPQDRFVVIVVDNHHAPTLTSGERFRVVHEPTPGSYAARNAGFRSTDAAVLAFTDAGCRPDRSWLAQGVDALQGHDRSIVGGRIELVASPQPTIAEQLELRSALDQARYVSQGYAATANLFIRRSDLDRLNGFDPGLRSGGDRDLGHRAIAAGWTYVYADEAVVEHPARQTFRAINKKARRVAAGAASVSRRHGGCRGALLHVFDNLRPPVRSTLELAMSERDIAHRLQLITGLWWIYGVNAWWTIRYALPGRPEGPRS